MKFFQFEKLLQPLPLHHILTLHVILLWVNSTFLLKYVKECPIGSGGSKSSYHYRKQNLGFKKKKKNSRKKNVTTKQKSLQLIKLRSVKKSVKGKGRRRSHNSHKAEGHEWGEQLLLAKNRSLQWVWRDLTAIPMPLYYGEISKVSTTWKYVLVRVSLTLGSE